VSCTITVKLEGTQTERIFVWNVKRNDKSEEMTMVGSGAQLSRAVECEEQRQEQ